MLKWYESPFTDEISAELFQELRSGIHKLPNYMWNKEELPKQWKESIIAPIYKKVDKIDCHNYRGIIML
jgi:hypothetical protein